MQTSTGRRKRAGSIFSTKSHLSTGYRYRDGHLLNIVGSPVQESNRTYLFESFIGRSIILRRDGRKAVFSRQRRGKAAVSLIEARQG